MLTSACLGRDTLAAYFVYDTYVFCLSIFPIQIRKQLIIYYLEREYNEWCHAENNKACHQGTTDSHTAYKKII